MTNDPPSRTNGDAADDVAERPLTVESHLDVTITERGFKHLPPIASTYGGHVRAYESSAALEPHVWLTSVAPVNLSDPTGPTAEAPLHLTLDAARRLIEQLTYLVEHHYHHRLYRQTEPSEGDPDG